MLYRDKSTKTYKITENVLCGIKYMHWKTSVSTCATSNLLFFGLPSSTTLNVRNKQQTPAAYISDLDFPPGLSTARWWLGLTPLVLERAQQAVDRLFIFQPCLGREIRSPSTAPPQTKSSPNIRLRKDLPWINPANMCTVQKVNPKPTLFFTWLYYNFPEKCRTSLVLTTS